MVPFQVLEELRETGDRMQFTFQYHRGEAFELYLERRHPTSLEQLVGDLEAEWEEYHRTCISLMPIIGEREVGISMGYPLVVGYQDAGTPLYPLFRNTLPSGAALPYGLEQLGEMVKINPHSHQVVYRSHELLNPEAYKQPREKLLEGETPIALLPGMKYPGSIGMITMRIINGC